VLIALIAAACMVLTDILATTMTLAETRGHGWIAGFLDMAAWYVSIATTSISVTTLGGHNTTQKVYVLALVGAANVIGTKLGEATGSRLFKTPSERLIASAARSGR
jgi:hypothetical protein